MVAFANRDNSYQAKKNSSMRIKHRYLKWANHPKTIKAVKAILDKYSLHYSYKEGLECESYIGYEYLIEFYLYEDSTDFDVVQKEISRFLKPNDIETEYEKADIKKAEWFIVEVGEYQYPQPEDDFGYLKATFNLDNYCHLCGIGKLQNAPYRLKSKPKQPNKQFWGLHWDFDAIFVRQETRNILESEGIQGIRFTNPVIHRTNVPVDFFYQLHIDTVLDNGFDSYNTKTITCKINNEENWNNDTTSQCCGRIKYHHPMVGGYLFDKSIFDTKFDIVNSNEYFGSGSNANRLQIVSKKFKDIVDKNKLKGMSFTPVMHNRLER